MRSVAKELAGVSLWLRLGAALLVALGLGIAAAAPVAAECDALMPSFREYAPRTKLVVIGDVIAVEHTGPWDYGGQSSRFTLRVRAVLRGKAPAIMHVRDVSFMPCADHKILAAKGDRIALALNGVAFTPPVHFSTIAWIRGRPGPWLGVETITESQVGALFRTAPPDTATASTSPAQGALPSAFVFLPGVAAGCGVLLVGSRRRRRLTRSSGSIAR